MNTVVARRLVLPTSQMMVEKGLSDSVKREIALVASRHAPNLIFITRHILNKIET